MTIVKSERGKHFNGCLDYVYLHRSLLKVLYYTGFPICWLGIPQIFVHSTFSGVWKLSRKHGEWFKRSKPFGRIPTKSITDDIEYARTMNGYFNKAGLRECGNMAEGIACDWLTYCVSWEEHPYLDRVFCTSVLTLDGFDGSTFKICWVRGGKWYTLYVLPSKRAKVLFPHNKKSTGRTNLLEEQTDRTVNLVDCGEPVVLEDDKPVTVRAGSNTLSQSQRVAMAEFELGLGIDTSMESEIIHEEY